MKKETPRRSEPRHPEGPRRTDRAALEQALQLARKEIVETEPHPSANTLNDYLEGALDETESAHVRVHAAGCETCRWIVVHDGGRARPPEYQPALFLPLNERSGGIWSWSPEPSLAVEARPERHSLIVEVRQAGRPVKAAVVVLERLTGGAWTHVGAVPTDRLGRAAIAVDNPLRPGVLDRLRILLPR